MSESWCYPGSRLYRCRVGGLIAEVFGCVVVGGLGGVVGAAEVGDGVGVGVESGGVGGVAGVAGVAGAGGAGGAGGDSSSDI